VQVLFAVTPVNCLASPPPRTVTATRPPPHAHSGAGVVAFVDSVYGAPHSLVAAGAYVCMGLACVLTSGTLIRGHVLLRRALGRAGAP
jgi:hypothetical protein